MQKNHDSTIKIVYVLHRFNFLFARIKGNEIRCDIIKSFVICYLSVIYQRDFFKYYEYKYMLTAAVVIVSEFCDKLERSR